MKFFIYRNEKLYNFSVFQAKLIADVLSREGTKYSRRLTSDFYDFFSVCFCNIQKNQREINKGIPISSSRNKLPHTVTRYI